MQSAENHRIITNHKNHTQPKAKIFHKIVKLYFLENFGRNSATPLE